MLETVPYAALFLLIGTLSGVLLKPWAQRNSRGRVRERRRFNEMLHNNEVKRTEAEAQASALPE